MASSCFSSMNGSVATATTYRSDSGVYLVQPSRSQVSLRPFKNCMISLSVPRTCFGNSHGISIITQAHAELAVEDLRDVDEVESVDASIDDGETDNGAAQSGFKLYVGNLPWSCNSEELASVFQNVGSVDMVEVIYDRESGRSRGFGFVTMSSMEDCNAAIQKLDGADYAGRTLRVNFPVRNKGESPPRSFRASNNSNKLFVGNLAWGVDDAMLGEMFSEYGQVLDARVVNDRETGRSRGFGFVTMSSEAEVNEAMNKMDGASVEGRNLRVNMAGQRPGARNDFF
ncbi:hypothetical protein KP509_20G084200 [Ceratopteris richardii]|uniref:RRM domain-containing protein n=1 Tax=Ceratopteris richardii TaxID=49495 RepID=A0A8T2SKV0_CERRI|nr:hypothetical protein KP509_20G084200 [Ceratopteris richardii]